MSMLSGVTANASAKEETDFVGKSYLADTGLQDFKIEVAFMTKSTGGALALNLHLVNDNLIFRPVIYITSGNAKGNKTTFTDKDGNEQNLPGFSQANAIALLAAAKPLDQLTDTEKVINLYDWDAKKDIPTKVQMVTELLDKEITLGLVKQRVDKNIKNDQGKYVPSGETRFVNEINKVFRKRDGLTVAEIRAQVKESVFKDQWVTKWPSDTVVDKTSGETVAATNVNLGAANTSTEASTESTGLFS